MGAAEVFTEAIRILEKEKSGSTSMQQQHVIFLNNRSAMYDKSSFWELSAADCEQVLDMDPSHSKARTRLLRSYEMMEQWESALVQVCAIQLLLMQQHRESMRMGRPPPPLPIPQSKIEEIVDHIVTKEVDKYKSMLENKQQILPSSYSILQFLRTYSDYHNWMKQAEDDVPLPEKLPDEIVDQVKLWFKRGRLYAHDRQFQAAANAFEEAEKLLLSNDESVTGELEADMLGRLYEWLGMTKHWHHDFEAALACYDKVQKLEPNNSRIYVKKAGVKMDSADFETALEYLNKALEIDSSFVDAMFHRANLYMLQRKVEEAKSDLEKCVSKQPNNVMARLRLASIMAAMDDYDGAMNQVNKAKEYEPLNSEVHSYRGELCFTRNEMKEAAEAFEHAIQLEPTNPTPYINAAMVVLNTPPSPGMMLDTTKAISMLEEAIKYDPQFTSAYVQLGQLRLGTSKDIYEAGEVIKLYDRALENCRTPEELKELCSMRVLAVAQVDAATLLKMETFNMA
jgi:mitochondrial import receptor subunit TOM70